MKTRCTADEFVPNKRLKTADEGVLAVYQTLKLMLLPIGILPLSITLTLTQRTRLLPEPTQRSVVTSPIKIPRCTQGPLQSYFLRNPRVRMSA